MSVVVTAPEGALPEGSQLTASLIDTAYVADAVEAAVDAKGKTAEDMVAIDVTILDADGNEIQPLAPVSVKFANAGVSGSDIAVYHIDSETGAANEVDTATATSRVQSFEADGFSVYVVVNQGEDARLTVKFMNGSTEVATMQVKKSDIGDQFDVVLYDPGTGTLAEDQVFRGWTDKSSYTVGDINSGMTIAQVRDAVKTKLNAGITDGETMTFYALTYIVYDVTYKAKESVVLGTAPVYVVNRGDEAEYTINMSYAPESSDQDFKGWFVNPVANAKINGAQAVEGTPYPNETKATLTGSITLTVDAPLGAWLIFKENGKNVSYTSPLFLETGQKTTEPTDPTRVGYTFGGWYTNAECTDGNEFTFGQELKTTTTVYAKWVPVESANYTVIIWKQNVNDAKDAADNAKTYDFAESVTLSGPSNSVINTVTANGTGDNRYASVNGTAKRYTGFHLNKFDENVTIAPEGTSVLNVYYDRNTVTLTFMEYQQSGWSGSWVEYETMTGLYGQTLEQNGYEWPTNRWWYDDYQQSYGGYSGAGTRTTFMEAFIISDGSSSQTFYGFAGNGNRTVYFYKQNADGTWPALNDPDTSVGTSNGTFNISDKYNGYKAVSYSTNGSSWTNLGNKDSDGYYGQVSNYSNLYIRYAPLQYNILFMDGVYVDGNGNHVEGYSSRGQLKEVENINFGSSIESYAEGGADYFAPTFNGFVFSGWYVDDACTTPFTWGTMPEGVTVYAKWVQTQYRVFLHPNVPTSDTSFSMGDQNTSFRVDVGETINAINGVRDDYELVGWYKDEKCTQNFNFEAYALNDSNTSAYDKTRSTELDKYGNPTEATNKDVDRTWITRSLDLYAKWRSKLLGAEGIGIVYDANGGSNAPTDTLLYKDDSQAVAQGASTAPSADKKFSHWVVQKWDGSKFVDTDVTVLPGDTYTVLKSSAKVVENEGSTAENPSFTYTVQLRAEYVAAEHPTKTHIIWYANNGTDQSTDENKLDNGTTVSGNNVPYNAGVEVKAADTFTYAGHTFIGWARVEEGVDAPDAVNFLWYKDGKFYSDAGCTKEATYIAADEKTPYHDLYAIWATDVEVEVTGSTDSKVYNGSEQTNDQYTVTYKVGGEEAALPTGITATETVTAATGTNVGTYENGSVTVTLSGSAAGYVIKTASATDKIKLIITPKAVTVTADNKTKAYGDADPELTATVEGLIGSDTINYTLSRAAGENVGEYTITPSGEATQGNYTVTYVPGTLTIEPKAVTITTGSDKKAYDGTPLTKDEATIEGLVEGETVTLKATGTITEVGTADNTYSIDWGTTSKDNYTVTDKLGKLEITTNAAEVTLTAPSDSKTYDGTALTAPGTEAMPVTANGLPEGFTVEATATGSQTDAGNSANVVNDGYVIKNAAGVDKTANFTNVKKADGTLTVNPKAVTITTGSDKKAYDGTPLTKDEATIEGLVEGETVTLKATGTITEVGNTPNTYSITWDKAKATNYTVTDNLGTLTVTSTDAQVVLTAASGSKTYDGTALTDATVTATGLPEGFTAQATATGTQTDAGSSANVVNDGYKFFDKDGNDKTANFTNVKKVDGTLTVNPAPVTITTGSDSKAYDGTPLTKDEATITGLVNNETATVKANGTITEVGTADNTYSITWDTAKASNYTVTENLGELEITTNSSEVTLTAPSDTKTYDGKALTAPGTAEKPVTASGLPEGFTVEATASGSQTDAGNSKNVVNDGYVIKNADGVDKTANFTNVKKTDGTLTVEPKVVTITTGSDKKAYDGTPLTKDEATIEGLVEGETVTLKATGTITEVGTTPNTYSITWDKAKADNYTVTEKLGTLEITTNAAEVTLTAPSDSKTYDGTALTAPGTEAKPVTATGLPEGFTVEATASGTITNVGKVANVVNDGFKILDADGNDKTANFTSVEKINGTLEITPRTVTLTSESDSKVYDGTALTKPEVTVGGGGFVAGEVTDIKATGTITEVGTVDNTITYTEGAAFKADNYDITKTEGKLTITAVTDKVTVTITEHKGEYTYDGTEKTVTGYDVTSISNELYKEADFSFSGNDTVKGTDAGTYDMELKPADFSNTSKNFTDVEFVIVDGQLVITPKHIDDPDDPGNPSKDLTVTGPEDTVYNGLEQKQPVQVTDKETGQVLVEGTDFELTYGDDMVNVGEVPVTVKGIGNYEGTFELSYKITPAPLKITTGSAEKVYDATPLTSDECEVEGLVNGETLRVDPDGSQTLVGSSDNTVTITWADDVIDHYPPLGARILSTVENPTAKKSNYEVEVTLGTLTVTDDGVPTDLVVTKTHEGEEFGLGETITFTLKATNIYDEERDITFVEIEGVEVAQATFEKVAPGETVETTATYTVTEADILAGEFKNQVTVKIGDAEHGPAEDIVVIEEKNPHLTVTKTVTSAAETYAVGETIEYKIVVENDGNLTISDIKVTDELTKDEWTIEQLAPGEKQEFTAKYTVTEADATAGKVVNTATATGKDPEGNDPSVTPGTTETPVKKPELPKTGDTSGLVSAAASASMGLMSLAGWLHTLRRRKEDDEQ